MKAPVLAFRKRIEDGGNITQITNWSPETRERLEPPCATVIANQKTCYDKQ